MDKHMGVEALSQKVSVLWVTPTVLDAELHKSARLQIIEQFAKAGHRTSLVALRSRQKPNVEKLPILTVPLRYVPVIQPIMFGVVLMFLLPWYVLHWQPDFIIFTQSDVSILGSIPGVLVSKLRKVKCVLDIRSIPVETAGIRGRLQELWFSISVLTAKGLLDGLTIITREMRNDVAKKYRIDPANVGVWTSGVSTSLYNPARYAGKKEELKDKFELTGKFVVFYQGVFSPNRGLTELVEAIRILKPNYPKIVAFMLGKGSSCQQLKDLIRKESLQDNVIIHGPVEYSDVPMFIALCDVATSPLPDNPYWRFSCPLKVLEYMAMEKTIILSKIPAHQAVVGRAKCGIYVDSVTPTEIATAIMYAFANRAALEDWGTTGRRIVEDKYTWEKVALDLEKYLLSLPIRHRKWKF
jgi:glycosyltransferase involved in cell wall biosynthesis